VLVPIQCEYYALEGLSQLLRNIELVRGGLNASLDIAGIVLTMYDARTKLSEEVAKEVRNHFGDKVFSTIVPRSVRLSEAPSYGQPAIVYERTSRGSRAYVWLAEEFDRRLLGGGTPIEAQSAETTTQSEQPAESEPPEASEQPTVPAGEGAA
jgi:chromosome partitioning protein